MNPKPIYTYRPSPVVIFARPTPYDVRSIGEHRRVSRVRNPESSWATVAFILFAVWIGSILALLLNC
jgi:hypothetical protein